MKSYPRYKYHQSLDPKLVQSEEHESALGEDWKESPAEFGVVTHPSSLFEEMDKPVAKVEKEKGKPGPKPKAEKE